MSSRIRAPSDLPELVRAGFAKALSEGELHYYPTQVTVLHANSVPVGLCLR
jgi:sulfate adenylyltransferase (ADP) / ATP adenylyltransferase